MHFCVIIIEKSVGSNKQEEVKVYEKAISSCNVDKYGAFFSGM